MSDQYVRVTDRRMFTADGELREEFDYLGKTPADDGETPASPAEPPAPRAEDPPPPQPVESEPQAAEPETAADGPGFPDLVRLLAEHASVYFTEAQRGDPQAAAQHLELARVHLDLLRVLQDKTRGNLTSDEQRMLDDVLYQLRSAFVGMQG